MKVHVTKPPGIELPTPPEMGGTSIERRSVSASAGLASAAIATKKRKARTKVAGKGEKSDDDDDSETEEEDATQEEGEEEEDELLEHGGEDVPRKTRTAAPASPVAALAAYEERCSFQYL